MPMLAGWGTRLATLEQTVLSSDCKSPGRPWGREKGSQGWDKSKILSVGVTREETQEAMDMLTELLKEGPDVEASTSAPYAEVLAQLRQLETEDLGNLSTPGPAGDALSMVAASSSQCCTPKGFSIWAVSKSGYPPNGHGAVWALAPQQGSAGVYLLWKSPDYSRGDSTTANQKVPALRLGLFLAALKIIPNGPQENPQPHSRWPSLVFPQSWDWESHHWEPPGASLNPHASLGMQSTVCLLELSLRYNILS